MNNIYSTQDFFRLELSVLDENGVNTLPEDVVIDRYAISLLSPQGSTREVTGTYDSVNEKVIYNSENNVFLTPPGKWSVRLILYLNTGQRILGTISTFNVSSEWSDKTAVFIK